MKSLRVFLLTALVLALAGCGAQSLKRSSPQQVLTAAEQDADHSFIVPTPKVDILFVVDNSLSMSGHQIRLASNISTFVEEFSKKATLDYHIGVLTIWDSDPVHAQMIQAIHPLGGLVPLRIPKDKSPENLSNPKSFMGEREDLIINGAMPPRFITRDTENKDILLKSTLFLGDEPGPQFEEMFSPVFSFFSPENISGPNAGFLRSDAYLLVVFITDANDQSMKVGDVSEGLSAHDLYTKLVQAKGDMPELVRIYTILYPQGASCINPATNKAIKRDNAGIPTKFIQLLNESGGKMASLCGDFGTQLANYARDFSTEVSRQVIPLKMLPDGNQDFQVTYGSQMIPKATAGHFDEGWSFAPSNIPPNFPHITIGGSVKLTPEPGAQIKINLTPIETRSLRKSPFMSPPVEEAPAQKTPAEKTTKPIFR